MALLDWLRGGNDQQLAAAEYAGRESASEKARRKQTQRGSMGRPHRTARAADRAGWAWADRQR